MLAVIVVTLGYAIEAFLIAVVPVVAPIVLLVELANTILVIAPPKAVRTIGSASIVKPTVPPVIVVMFGNANAAFLITVVPVMAPITLFVLAWKASTAVMLALNRVSFPVAVDATVGFAPFMFKFVAFVKVTVGLRICAVPLLTPRFNVAAAPKAVTEVGSGKIVMVPALPVIVDAPVNAIVAFLIAVVPVVEPIVLLIPDAKTLLVTAPPNAVSTIGSAKNVTPNVDAVTVVKFVSAKVAFLIAVVPVVAPITLFVLTWKASTAVMLALNKVSFPVAVDATVGLAPLMFKFVAFVKVTVGLRICAVPLLTPRFNVAAAPKAVTDVGSGNIVIVPALPVIVEAPVNAIVAFLIAVVPVVAPIVLFVPDAKIILVTAPP